MSKKTTIKAATSFVTVISGYPNIWILGALQLVISKYCQF